MAREMTKLYLFILDIYLRIWLSCTEVVMSYIFLSSSMQYVGWKISKKCTVL